MEESSQCPADIGTAIRCPAGDECVGYLRAFEDGDFDSAWAIGAVLLVLVLAINLAARLAKTKLKQKQ